MRRPLVLAVAFGLVASCGGEGEDGPPAQRANTVVLDGTVANDHGSASVTASGAHLEIAAGDFYFEPTVVTGPAGETLSLSVASASQNVHNVTVGEISEDVGPGETIELQLEFPASGTAVFVCSYHRDQGMAGALVST